MLGPYGGSVQSQNGCTRERASAEVLAVIGGAPEEVQRRESSAAPAAESAIEATEPAPADAVLRGPVAIALRSNGHELEYEADLGHCERLTLGGPASDWLEMLSGVSEFVANLHASGRAHGELRIGMLLRRERQTVVIVPPAGVDAAALLAARLRAGAHPTEVAYAAPEVAHGSPATPASDVYALSALAFAAIGRRAPLALVDARSSLSHLGDDVADTLIAALDPRPERRPNATALARALRDAVAPQRAVGADVATPPEAASILGAALMVGAVAVLTGVFGLALTRWGQVGATARLLSLGVFTLAVFGAGAAVLRSGNRRSGVGLCVLAAQLSWADAWLLLAILGLEDSYAAWAITGAVIGVFQCGLAARLGWVLLGGFGALAFTVSAVTLGLFLPIGTGHGPPAFAASIALVLFLTELGLSRWLATTATLSVASGFWIAASAALSVFPLAAGRLDALVWPYVLVAASLALSKTVEARAKVLWLAALSLLVVAPSVQALVLLEHGFTAQVVAALVTLGLAAGVARVGTSGWALAASIPAAVWTTTSVVMAMTAADALQWMWTYALAALAGATARFAKSSQARLAGRVLAVTALGMLILAPSVQALVLRDRPAVFLLVAVLGLALVGYATAKDLGPRRERAAIAVGLAAATLSPSVLALVACMGHAASDLDESARFGGADRWAYLASCAVVSAVLVTIALPPSGLRRVHRRALELGALAVGPGVAFALSLPVVREDVCYSTLALLLGGAGLAVALLRWRLVLAAVSAGLMLLVLSVQYFAKLASALHWGLLAVGFGLLVLTAATLYERKLKQLLPDWNRWE